MTTPSSPPLPVGVYVLAVDVKNPGPRDKRLKHDWRQEEKFPEGLLVRVVADNHEIGKGAVTLFRAEPWGEFGAVQQLKLDDPRFLAMLPHLSPATDPVTLLDEQLRQLTSVSLERLSHDVLLTLLRSGELRSERVVTIVAEELTKGKADS